MDEQLRFTGFENVGFVGETRRWSRRPPRVRRPAVSPVPDGDEQHPGRELRFEGFDIDQTASDTGIRVPSAGSRTVCRAERLHPWRPRQRDVGAGWFDITDPDGRGLVERFCGRRRPSRRRYAERGEHVAGPTGIGVDPNHRGTLVFDGCVLGGFPAPDRTPNETGRIDVDGGRFRNSGTASIRLGGATGTIRTRPSSSTRIRTTERSARDSASITGTSSLSRASVSTSPTERRRDQDHERRRHHFDRELEISAADGLNNGFGSTPRRERRRSRTSTSRSTGAQTRFRSTDRTPERSTCKMFELPATRTDRRCATRSSVRETAVGSTNSGRTARPQQATRHRVAGRRRDRRRLGVHDDAHADRRPRCDDVTIENCYADSVDDVSS